MKYALLFVFLLASIPLAFAQTGDLPYVEIGKSIAGATFNWNLLFNFPASCSPGEAVQGIGTTLTCAPISGNISLNDTFSGANYTNFSSLWQYALGIGGGSDTFAGENYTNFTKMSYNVSLYAYNVSRNWTEMCIMQFNVTNDTMMSVDNVTINKVIDNTTLYAQNVSLNWTNLAIGMFNVTNLSAYEPVWLNWTLNQFNPINLNTSNGNFTGYINVTISASSPLYVINGSYNLTIVNQQPVQMFSALANITFNGTNICIGGCF